MDPQELLDIRDVLDRVRVPVTKATIYNWMRRQRFPKPHGYIGPTPYWTDSQLEEWERAQLK